MKAMLAAIPLALVLLVSWPASAAKPQSEMRAIADAIDEGEGDAVEPVLLGMRDQHPKDAAVLALLARIEYLRAVDGLSQYPGMPPSGWDPERMDAAERWVREAVEADPRHANAWVVYGQIKYARNRLAESLDMLERAESLEPTSVKLRLRKGATLRALASYRGEDALLDDASREYAQVIHGAIDDGNERLAASELAEIASARGDYAGAIEYLTKSIATSHGTETAFLLDKRAKDHLFAGHVDMALKDIKDALARLDFGVGRQTLAMVRLVQSGIAMRDGDADTSLSHLKQALETGTDPDRVLPVLASSEKTFPALYALFEPHVKAAGGSGKAAPLFCNAASFIGDEDLRRLKSFGADLDAAEPQGETLLHCAIDVDNVAAVRTLLDLGADTSLRHPDGSTLLERTLVGTSPARKEIRRLILAKVGTPPGWQEPDVDLPLRGHWYRVDRDIGADGGKRLAAGTTMLASGACSIGGRNDVCITFYTRPGEYYGTVLIPLSRLSDLKALHEVPAPSAEAAK
jgi:tetratricopeptide (TPR) repeat protein